MIQKVIKMPELIFTETEVRKRGKTRVFRYPNLNTVLMVEEVLKLHRDIPMKVAELKKKLPKKVMHQTLLLILDYLQASGKIIIGTKGVQWIYADREHLQAMLKGGLEI